MITRFAPRRMPIEVQLRKLNREIQQEGILTEARQRRYFAKDITRRQRRESAKRRLVIRRARYGY
ncbi:MAG: Uncharacterized protein CEN88_435 [Candidatus Berkelbacteria bacterium Licking1014_2]|uniref:Small ribosomal subunit protein bS21 n=1 Tax=Candidatus Berkelbacteria bacterium Licking1014_2 TaxID=2017146 RepID=A0A554LSH2_9BACT|nr:MAG: Uncharacterized protein CEN88_435 [Candidatus Berkelbacteria bacterium Licking1014_2]